MFISNSRNLQKMLSWGTFYQHSGNFRARNLCLQYNEEIMRVDNIIFKRNRHASSAPTHEFYQETSHVCDTFGRFEISADCYAGRPIPHTHIHKLFVNYFTHLPIYSTHNCTAHTYTLFVHYLTLAHTQM